MPWINDRSANRCRAVDARGTKPCTEVNSRVHRDIIYHSLIIGGGAVASLVVMKSIEYGGASRGGAMNHHGAQL